MAEEMRLNKTMKNTLWAIVGYVGYTIVGFVSRSVFIQELGVLYNGVNGYFSGILSLFSLAEMGIGFAIGIHLYKPLAQNDQRKVAALMAMYARAYRMIALAIAAMGLLMTPFLYVFIKDGENVQYLRFYFLLYVLKTVISYCFSYRSTLIEVDQRRYIVTNATNLFLILQVLAQIAVLKLCGSFTLYLLAQIICTFGTNLYLYLKAGKLYPYIITYKKEKLNPEERRNIFSYIRAYAVNQVANAIKSGTDSTIITKFAGLVNTGITDNYSMIVSCVRTITGMFFSSVGPGIGNLSATVPEENQYNTLMDLLYVAFFLYGYCGVCLFVLLNPLIVAWIGADFLLPLSIVGILVANFFVQLVNYPASIFFSVRGYIKRIPYLPLINVVVNVVVSLALAGPLGILGVYLGTLISYLCSSFLAEPYFVLKYTFHGRYREYFVRYLRYFGVCLVCLAAAYFAAAAVPLTSFWGVLLKWVICSIIFCGIFLTVFHKTREQKTIFRLGLQYVKGLLHLQA